MDHIFLKVFIEFVTTRLVLCFGFLTPRHVGIPWQGTESTPCWKANYNHWTTRVVLTSVTILMVMVPLFWASLVAQLMKTLPATQETQEMRIQSLGWEDPREKKMATLSNILAWKIPCTEGSGGLLYSPWGHKESDTTENTSPCTHAYITSYLYQWWGNWNHFKVQESNPRNLPPKSTPLTTLL